ncbi:MAG TPA: hypothetical protein VMW94_10340 [Actinomycetes bacterium]|nr:hypothetical protein [Actinomycetes bacterium]
MAHNVTLAADTASAIADAVATLCNGGTVKIYDGAQPADPDTAVTTQTLLATCTFGTPAFAAAVDGVATANAITQDASADASGTAAWFRILSSAAAAVLDGTVGVGVGFDCNVVTTAVVAAAAFPIASMTLTEA